MSDRDYHDDILDQMEEVSEEDQLYREAQAQAAFDDECDRLAYEQDMDAFREDHGPWPTEAEVASYEAACGEVEHAA